MRAIVALAGPITDTPLVRRWLAGADLLVAADSGAERLAELEIQPQVVVGDFDSLSAGRLAALRDAGVEIVPHPDPNQKTDGHAALLLAVERGAAEIVVLGAMGGPRLDQVIANALIAAGLRSDAEIWLVDGWTEAKRLWAPAQATVTFRGEPGDQVSLIPITDEVRGVSTHGLRWDLDTATLARGDSVAISNELMAAEGGFTIAAGVALAAHDVGARQDQD